MTDRVAEVGDHGACDYGSGDFEVGGNEVGGEQVGGQAEAAWNFWSKKGGKYKQSGD